MFDDFPEAPKRERVAHECCKEWDGFAGQMDHAWRVLHMLCHSRVPFTDEYVARWAGLSVRAAGRLAIEATERGWCSAGEEFADARPGAGRMWIGSLTARRRL